VKTLCDTLLLCAEVYNRCVAERREVWKRERRCVSVYEQKRLLPAWKQEDERFKSVYSQVLQDVVFRVDRAYKAFYRQMRQGVRTTGPRYKTHERYHSLTYPQDGFALRGNRLHVAKVGDIRIKMHRPLGGRTKTLTLCQKADGWYASFACDVVQTSLPPTGRIVGVDLGIENFATTSDGETFPFPGYTAKARPHIKRAEGAVKCKQKGSNRQKKAELRWARLLLHVGRQRKDTAHKTARSLVNRYDLIAVEHLQPKKMARNRLFTKYVYDAGWGIFVRILVSKAEGAGRQVVQVDPHYTSQICSGCGRTVPKKITERWHTCPHCGCSLSRDVNAAINILNRALVA
jgi:putative transposase